MTDNEIIKALECCAKAYCQKYNCPMYENTINTKDCITKLSENALSLINRQKAEIERLRKNNAERVDFFAKMLKAEKKKRKRSVRSAETEAIKEFARRVKATFPTRDDARCTDDDIFTLDSIDRIMNDMLTGEKT